MWLDQLVCGMALYVYSVNIKIWMILHIPISERFYRFNGETTTTESFSFCCHWEWTNWQISSVKGDQPHKWPCRNLRRCIYIYVFHLNQCYRKKTKQINKLILFTTAVIQMIQMYVHTLNIHFNLLKPQYELRMCACTNMEANTLLCVVCITKYGQHNGIDSVLRPKN